MLEKCHFAIESTDKLKLSERDVRESTFSKAEIAGRSGFAWLVVEVVKACRRHFLPMHIHQVRIFLVVVT